MLLLSRKKDETIHIFVGGVEITVTVVEIRGDKVRLAFEAPRDVIIHRSEVLRAIKKTQELERQNAISTADSRSDAAH